MERVLSLNVPLNDCDLNIFFFPLFTDEVDVVGYASNQSDDDFSSVQSIRSASSSDSGVAMSTSRLTLSEAEFY